LDLNMSIKNKCIVYLYDKGYRIVDGRVISPNGKYIKPEK